MSCIAKVVTKIFDNQREWILFSWQFIYLFIVSSFFSIILKKISNILKKCIICQIYLYFIYMILFK